MRWVPNVYSMILYTIDECDAVDNSRYGPAPGHASHPPFWSLDEHDMDNVGRKCIVHPNI